MKTMKKVCKFCGKEFYTEVRAARYCSPECKEQSHYHGTVCKVCGKPTKDNKATCSVECEKKWHSINNPFRDTEKMKQAMLIKYGVDNPMKVDSIKNKVKETKESNPEYYKEWREKFESTMEDKYGVKNALESQEFLDKMNQTLEETGISYRFHTPEWNQMMIEKYGTTIPYQNSEIKQKGINTLLEKYGVTSPAKLDFVQEKSKQTCLQKYGVEYSFQSENNKQKAKQTLLERYGVENSASIRPYISKINQKIGEQLQVDSYEYTIGQKRFDLKKGNLLIEVNPTVSHNSDKDYVFGIIDKDYHQNKMNLAIQNGFECMQIWDWDDLDKIEQSLTTAKTAIGARECEVVFIDKSTSDTFLNNYHYQNTCQGDIARVGLVYDTKLIAVMTFGVPRYTDKYQVELLRLCYHPKYKITGGSNKMFKFFIENYKPDSIISYCDLSKFSGNVYISLGFKLLNEGKPSAHWYNIKTHKHFTDNIVRQRGFDQLLGSEYGYFGKDTSNEQLMLEHNFVRVYDCGQNTYVWSKE